MQSLKAITLLLTLCLFTNDVHPKERKFEDEVVKDSISGKNFLYSELVKKYKAALKEQCPALEELDGCSAPYGEKPKYYRVVFTPACIRHDICYRCAETYKWTREECDNAFHRDMVALCNSQNPVRPISSPKKCKGVANYYYNGVRAFGSSSHGVKAKDWCSEECSKRGGDPSLTEDSEHNIETFTDWQKLKADLDTAENDDTSASGSGEEAIQDS
uniref:Toxin candidate TRINITY_DN20991_c0_g3_i3 n=1 Tax=Ceriantheomorphe brasiliensis TaxID=1048506 RepID=A0A7G7WZ14_9CNID|nr:toxin candidate TRINITY_DN20991_c0_g3_i3 [Ceriantheomorphe brasiliensis]